MNGLMIRPVGPFDHAIIASIHAGRFVEPASQLAALSSPIRDLSQGY